MNTLVAISGGMDSTFLMWKILSQSNDAVHAFYIDFSEVKPDEHTAPFYAKLAAIEIPACQRIVHWLGTNVRAMSFEVVTSGIVTNEEIPRASRQRRLPNYPRSGNTRAWRVLPMLTAASKLMTGRDRFVYGKTEENRRSSDYQAREQFDQLYWKEIAPANTTFEMPLINERLTRAHALRDLPQELQALVISCDTPMLVNGKPLLCGFCSKCVMTADARGKLKQGMSPEAIQEEHLRLRRAGPHRNNTHGGSTRFGG